MSAGSTNPSAKELQPEQPAKREYSPREFMAALRLGAFGLQLDKLDDAIENAARGGNDEAARFLNKKRAEILTLLDLDINGTAAESRARLLAEMLSKGAVLDALSRFQQNSGRGEGPIKRLVREVLPSLEKQLMREATAEEIWHACERQRGHKIHFQRADDVWRKPLCATPPGRPSASWARFQVIVSEVRRPPKT